MPPSHRKRDHWNALDLAATREAVFEGELPEWVAGAGIWLSNGGPGRGHAARSYPFTLGVALPPGIRVEKLALVGVFAEFSGKDLEGPGTIGASLALEMDGKQVWRLDLVNGRHYQDSTVLGLGRRTSGDGLELNEIGVLNHADGVHRVDFATFDLPQAVSADRLVLKDLGSPASFGVLGWAIEPLPLAGCPFHSAQGGGIALSEIPGILRLGDRFRLAKARQLLDQSLRQSPDLDEAKGEALTFLAVVTATMLEMGGGREMHRVQLDAARALDRLGSVDELADEVQTWLDEVTGTLAEPRSAQSTARLVDRALALLDRHFARDLSDEEVAKAVGLSTSHFRYLFRQATGQPFNKYLVNLRLEKARAMLVAGDLPVTAVASAVGFASLSHFSRAFAQRFSVSPANLRRMAG